MGGLFGPIGAGVLHSISENLNESHKNLLEKQAKEEETAKSIYSTLLSYDDAEVRAKGLAGLAALARGEKNAAKNATKFLEGLTKLPTHQDAEKFVKGVDQQKQRTQAAPSPAPAPAGPPPSPTVDLPSGSREEAQNDGPPAPPPMMSAALPTSSPVQGGGVNPTPSVGAAPAPSPAPAAPPSMEDTLTDYGRMHTPGEVNLRRADLTKRDLASDANATKLKMTEDNIAARIAAKGASSAPYMLSGAEAELAGVPEGTVINPKIFSTLYHEKHADLRTATQAATTRYSADQRVRAADNAVMKYDTVDDEGHAATGFGRKGELAGQTIVKPAAAMTRAKADHARVILSKAGEIKQKLADPNFAAQMGPIIGRIHRGEIKLGDAPVEAQTMYTALKSFSDLQAYLHGARGIAYKHDFEDSIGNLERNPALVTAAIDELADTAQDFVDVTLPKKHSAPPKAPADLPPTGSERKQINGVWYVKKDGAKGRGWYKE